MVSPLLDPRLVPTACRLDCRCLWYGHEPRNHPTRAHTTVQMLPTCPEHGAWVREHVEPWALRRLEAATFAACTRARVTGHPASWHTWLWQRFMPVPTAFSIPPPQGDPDAQ